MRRPARGPNTQDIPTPAIQPPSSPQPFCRAKPDRDRLARLGTLTPQSVEGIDPTEATAKVPLEVTSGGLIPSWGGVRRGRVMRRVAGRGTTGLQHILLRLTQARLWQTLAGRVYITRVGFDTHSAENKSHETQGFR